MKLVGHHETLEEVLDFLNLKYEEISENSEEIYLIDAIFRKNGSINMGNNKTLLEIWNGIIE